MKTDVKQIYRGSEKFFNQEVIIEGWIRTSRSSKTFGFLELNDGTFFKNLQIVYDDNLINFKEIEKLSISSSIKVKGILVPTPEAKQPFEVKAIEIEVEGNSAQDYPIQKKRHTMEYLRSIAHLRPRTNTYSAVFRTRSVLAYAIHKFFQERGFVYVHTPIITASDAEGAGEMMVVKSISVKTFLGRKPI
jgi:asparaginyl-tRNA synthetase